MGADHAGAGKVETQERQLQTGLRQGLVDGDPSHGQREAGGDQLLTNPFAGLEDRLIK